MFRILRDDPDDSTFAMNAITRESLSMKELLYEKLDLIRLLVIDFQDLPPDLDLGLELGLEKLRCSSSFAWKHSKIHGHQSQADPSRKDRKCNSKMTEPNGVP